MCTLWSKSWTVQIFHRNKVIVFDYDMYETFCINLHHLQHDTPIEHHFTNVWFNPWYVTFTNPHKSIYIYHDEFDNLSHIQRGK